MQAAAQRFWAWTSRARPAHPRWSGPWWREQAVIWTVFGVTGSTSMYAVRPLLKRAGFEGSMTEGPNSYRAASLLMMTPAYSVLLLSYGTLFGRHVFFRKQVIKMWGRIIPPLKRLG